MAKGTKVCRLTKLTEPVQEPMEGLCGLIDGKEGEWKASEYVLVDSENLTSDQVSRIKALIDEFACVFSKDDTDLGQSIYSHKILLTEDMPTKSRPYRAPNKQLKVVEEHLDQMLRMGVIRRSKSPWGGRDGREIGRLTKILRRFSQSQRENHQGFISKPLSEDKLKALGGCEFFTTLDMASGYWQLKMDDESNAF